MSDSRRIVEGTPAPVSGKPSVGEKRNGRPHRGRWGKDDFVFNSEDDEILWRRDAYRQSVNHEGWQRQRPVDDRLQATLDAMPELAEGRYFRGADNRHRPIGREQREAPEVERIRRRAFTELANTGITWEELGAYEPDRPHPGEDEAMALAQTRSTVGAVASPVAGPLKTRDMGALPETPQVAFDSVGKVELNLRDAQELWGVGREEAASEPVLVASNGRINPGALPKNVAPMPKFAPPSRPIPSFQQRHDFARTLVDRAANDNVRSTNTERLAIPAKSIDSNTHARLSGTANIGAGSAGQVEPDPEFDIASPLFNWRRDGKPEPAPADFAIYTVSDEGRFTYLEDKKDEWSQHLASNPESVFRDMAGEVEKLSVAAQRDFYTSYHRPANEAEIAEINDAVERIVFAPAERWSEGVRHLGGEPLPRPYLGVAGQPSVTVDEAFAILNDVLVAAPEASKRWGKSGNEETQRHVPILAERMIKELKRCGVQADLLKYEKQLKIQSSNKGARWSDIRIEFEVDGITYAIDINHAAYLRSKHQRTKGEQAAFSDIVSLRKARLGDRDFPDYEGAVISFPKKQKKQTDSEYMELMNEFLSRLVDCKSAVKVRVTNPYDIAIIAKSSSNIAND